MLLLSVCIILLIAIPSCFAHENDTIISIDEENSDAVGISSDVETLSGSNDYYFNASLDDDDGDGSIQKPYKYLNAERIKANCNIHLADGEYVLYENKSIDQVNIFGENVDRTILRFDGLSDDVMFKVYNSLTLTNLTITDASICNYMKLNATNVIFKYGYGSVPDRYSNTFGGAIDCPGSDSYTLAVNIKNCTFSDNYAVYGGAIYMSGGSLDISDSFFINNYAYNFGGAIACEYGTDIKISKTKFSNCRSVDDAGGSIYTKQATLKLEHVDIVNSSATFGGAIASLSTAFSSNYLSVQNCSAKWDGGAIFHLYGNFTSVYGNFKNNSANNGGALYIDNSTNMFLRLNTFERNHANLVAGGVYSLCNSLRGAATVLNMNTFISNTALFQPNAFEASSINLSISNGNYEMYRNNESEITVIPSSYSLLDYNLLTIPKDQQSSGNCWAFTALSVLESAILKASGLSLDLSEENMKNIIARYSDYGWNMETNDGGYTYMPYGYLVSWLGPVLENDDSFDDYSTLSPILDSVMHVQNIKFLKRDNFLDNDEIKMAIMKYGAVGTSMLYDTNFFRGNGYYCWYNGNSNHAVTIVGWDDNYSRNNFYGLPSGDGDGAWLVRNSWGPNWNDNGYFYVSYYDEKLAQPGIDGCAYAIILNDTIRYEKNYQYDIAGRTDYYYVDSPSVWYKNIFAAENNEYIAAVSTYFEKITNWTASVYVNGELKALTSGISNPGYYTFDLGQLIPVKIGDIFEVEFKVSNDDVNSIPISEYSQLNKLIYKPEISFISLDGNSWSDLFYVNGTYGTHTYKSQVACIKAFTILNEIGTALNLTVNNNDGIAEIMATVIDQYGNIVKNGNVTFNFNGEDFVVNLSNGIASIAQALKGGNNSISATFNAIGYNSSSSSTRISTPKEDVLISASARTVRVDQNAIVNVVLNDDATGNVSISVDGTEYLGTVENGNAVIELPVIPQAGSYAFVVIYSGDDKYLAESTPVTFNVNKYYITIKATARTVHVADNVTVNVAVSKDATGKVSIFVGDVEYSGTIENGNAVIIIPDLPVGQYSLEVVYSGDEKYKNKYNVVTFNVNKYKSTIKATARTVRLGDDVTVNVVLPKDATGNVSIVIDGITYYGVASNGAASIILPNLPVNQYALDVLYDGDEKYKPSSGVVTFNVNKQNSVLKPTARTVKVGADVTVNVEVSKDATGNVSIVIDGVSYYGIISNGVASIIIPDLPAGQYALNVQYSGDGKYKTRSATVTFNVNKNNVRMKATARTVKIGNDVRVNVALSSDASGNVSININGTDYVGVVEGGNAVIVLPNLPVNQYALDVAYSGDEKYKPYTSVVTFNVNK